MFDWIPTRIIIIISVIMYYKSLVSVCVVGFNQGFKFPTLPYCSIVDNNIL